MENIMKRPVFDVFINNLDNYRPEYYQPNDFYIVLYKLFKSYGISYNEHNLHCIICYFKVLEMVVWWQSF
jgi:hypothetical protein